MKNSALICFVGIDGSGKTTHARVLVRSMQKRGIELNYVWGRYRPMLTLPVMILGKKLLLRGKDIRSDYREYASTKRHLFREKSLSSVYPKLVLLDYLFQILIKIRIPLALGRKIVCDRYLDDTIITDLATYLDYSNEKVERLFRSCSFMFPEPGLTFLIDVPEIVAFRRKKDTPSLDYLFERRELYLGMAEQHKMLVLDGTESFKVLQRAIEEQSLKYMSGLA